MKPLSDIIRAAHFSPIEDFSGVYNVGASVERQMSGRTHFFDPSTMRFFSGKVLRARSLDDGAILGTICSQAEGFHGGRVYVVNFHDFTGHCLSRENLGSRSFKTMAQADKAFWKRAETFDGRAVVVAAIRREHDDAKAKAASLSRLIRNNSRMFKREA